VVAKLASHLMPLQEHQGNFTAPQVIECATLLPFALVILEEIGWVDELKERETVPEGSERPHKTGSVQRIKADAELPPYERYPRSDALELLRFWRGSAADEERAWLEGRLRDHPTDVKKFLDLFLDKYINYDFISEFADPAIIAKAGNDCLGEALTDLNRHSDELSEVRLFLDAHERRSARQEDRQKPPAEDEPTVKAGEVLFKDSGSRLPGGTGTQDRHWG
jgi:hypothetical protein